MENKNFSASPGLNTINIAYSLRAHDALASLRRRQETTLQYSHPRPSYVSPKNSSPAAQQAPETTFNDGNLKYGKSQTLKEAVFNRLRIHIYRRDKRPKWLQLPNSDDRPQQQHPQPEHPQPVAKQRENKTSLNSRKDLTSNSRRPPQLKTSSSEEAGVEVSWRKTGEQGSQLGMVDRQKINSIVRSLLENAKLDERSYSRYVANAGNDDARIARRKSRKLSNSINAISKGPFALKKLFSPPRLHLQSSQTPQQAADREGFQAWENSDVFSSNRHGIVEYTKQYVNPERGAGEKSQNNIFSSKKRRFVIREKK